MNAKARTFRDLAAALLPYLDAAIEDVGDRAEPSAVELQHKAVELIWGGCHRRGEGCPEPIVRDVGYFHPVDQATCTACGRCWFVQDPADLVSQHLTTTKKKP